MVAVNSRLRLKENIVVTFLFMHTSSMMYEQKQKHVYINKKNTVYVLKK